jgi:hypothetical protein
MQLNLILSFLAISLAQTTLPQLPFPPGPYVVGRIVLHWVDANRADIIGNGHRELLAQTSDIYKEPIDLWGRAKNHGCRAEQLLIL